MSRFLVVTRGEHHDDTIWYSEVFDVREGVDARSWFEGCLAGVVSIWGDFSLAFGYHQHQFYSDGSCYKSDFIRWRPRDEGKWMSCSMENLCLVLLDTPHAAIELRKA